MKFYVINLGGGGADEACEDCLEEIKKYHRQNTTIVSVARVANAGAFCVGCGAEGEGAA